MPHGALETLNAWLAHLPSAARTTVAVDGDRLLADSGVLGKAALTDSTGRSWQLAVFRGDDLAFRLAYRKARSQERVLIVLTRGASAESRIAVSYVSDLLAANEAGPPLDLSLAAVFRRICPKINFPVAELRGFKDELLANLDGVPEAAKKIIDKFGKPDDWATHHVAALVLLVRHPDWNLADIWPDEVEPEAAIAHALRMMLAVPGNSADLPVIRKLLAGLARPAVQPHLYWADAGAAEIAAYLVLRKFAADVGLQNPAVQLRGVHLFSLDLPIDRLEGLASAVIARLAGNARDWQRVERRAEEFLTPQRTARLNDLIRTAGETALSALSSPVLLLPYLQTRLRDYFADRATGLAWGDAVINGPAVQADVAEATDRRRQCLATARLTQKLATIEQRLADPIPALAHADDLLEWYVHSDHHKLELDVARALHDREECGDEDLATAAAGYLLGGDDERNPRADSLLARVWQRLDELDGMLADFIAASPDQFASGPKSFVSFIHSACADKTMGILTGDSDRRVWLLIFDGMRYDTWQEIVKPLLGEYFRISEEPRFCTLPSYTLYARRSLLAGAPPSAWVSAKKASSHSESELFARNVGLGAHEIKEKLRLVTDAETTKARTAMKSKDAQARPFNILIYPISDECHKYHSNLASFNSEIRRKLMTDPATGVRGILDDLLGRVWPGDIVLAASDHGFVELPPCWAVEVSKKETAARQVKPEDSVMYRYAKDFRPSAMRRAIEIDVAGESHALCVGRSWLKREGVAATARYSHGGVSLAELVVPVATLERVSEKVALVEIVQLRAAVAVDEDEQLDVPFAVVNRGNVPADFEIVVHTNLGDVLLEEKGTLKPAETRSLRITVAGVVEGGAAGGQRGSMTAVSVRLRHTDLAGKWRDAIDGMINVPVNVRAKKTKLTASALDAFDGLLGD